MYCFASCVGEQLLYYIRDVGTPKAVWENLKKIFAASTTARKLQLRQELSNLRQRDLSVADYTLKINEICDSLASIDVNVDESEKVQICLGGLASKFGAFRTAVCTREATSSLFDLQSMLLVQENHVGAAAMGAHTDNKMLYAEGERPRGSGEGRNESVGRGGDRQRRHQKDASGNLGPSGGRGSRGKLALDCWYCGKRGHGESECMKKRAESGKTASGPRAGWTDGRNRQQLHYTEGSEEAAVMASAFVMSHGENSVKR
jgi:hypothetical protein